MKKAVAVLVVVLVLAVLAAWGGWSIVENRVVNRVVVINRSGQPIHTLLVKVCGQTLQFEDIADGKSVSAPFAMGSDDHFTWEGQLKDGTEIHGEGGYVTNGMYGEQAILVVEPGGTVAFDQKR